MARKLNTFFERERIGNFRQIMNDCEEFKNSVDSLECVTLKNYFKVYMLLLKGCLLRKCLNAGKLSVTKTECINVYDKALDICSEHFGRSWVTYDCCNERKDLFLQFYDGYNAKAETEKLFDLLKYMSVRKARKLASCSLDSGKHLMYGRIEERKADLGADARAIVEAGAKRGACFCELLFIFILIIILLVVNLVGLWLTNDSVDRCCFCIILSGSSTPFLS